MQQLNLRQLTFFKALAETSSFTKAAERTMLTHGMRFAPVDVFNYHQTIVGMVQSGAMIGIVPAIASAHLLPEGLVCIPLADPVANINRLVGLLSLVCRG